jgi:hypothetical protein
MNLDWAVICEGISGVQGRWNLGGVGTGGTFYEGFLPDFDEVPLFISASAQTLEEIANPLIFSVSVQGPRRLQFRDVYQLNWTPNPFESRLSVIRGYQGFAVTYPLDGEGDYRIILEAEHPSTGVVVLDHLVNVMPDL